MRGEVGDRLQANFQVDAMHLHCYYVDTVSRIVCVCVLIFVYSFTELCQVLATVHGIFSLSCGMQDPFLFVVCGIFN